MFQAITPVRGTASISVNILLRWSPDLVAGVIDDPTAPEYYPLKHPNRIVTALNEVANLNRGTRSREAIEAPL